ncbi:MAG TPA: haloacid dehalogenase-like hydrolase [Stellaceae bacterium]
MSAADTASEPVLCVDLDGTLARGDTMVRAGRRLLVRKPWLAPRLAWWNLRGRGHLKDQIARRAAFDAASLLYHQGLLRWLREEKTRGRRIIIASGADRRVVTAVARHLGLFDDIVASDGRVNLTGARKAAALQARFGAFDYVGNSRTDLAVWRHARRSYLVARRRGHAARFGRLVHFARIFDATEEF